MLDLPRLDTALNSGALHALAATASSYTAGHHITFHQTVPEIQPWRRTQRFSLAGTIGLEHLLASSAIPLTVDIERLNRINLTLSILTEEQKAKTRLRPVEMLIIAPSQRLDDIASRHRQLPSPVRALLAGMGATEIRGAALASYLLFESSYTTELIRLGH